MLKGDDEMRFFKSKIFKAIVALALVVVIVSGSVVLINYVEKENQKNEPSFFETMNGESVMLMPTEIVFAHSSSELYYTCMYYAEKVYKVSSDMHFWYIKRTDLLKNIKEVACGKMVRFDVDENHEFFQRLENKENTSGEFSKSEFIKNNKSAWGVQYFSQSEISSACSLIDYVVFEQKDGSIYIGFGFGGCDDEQKQQWGCCIAIFKTEIVDEDDIMSVENNMNGDYCQLIDDYLFDIDCDGEKEHITVIGGGGDMSTHSKIVAFIINEKGFGALKQGTDFRTKYYDMWGNGERCFLEENGELYYCCEGRRKSKHKITLNKEKQKVVVENLALVKNKPQVHTEFDINNTTIPYINYDNIETTAAP